MHWQKEILQEKQSSCCSAINPSRQWAAPQEEAGTTSCETCPCRPWRRTRRLDEGKENVRQTRSDFYGWSQVKDHVCHLDSTRFSWCGFQTTPGRLPQQWCLSSDSGLVPCGAGTHPPAAWVCSFCPWPIPVNLGPQEKSKGLHILNRAIKLFNREVLTSTRKGSKQVQKEMNLPWRQQNQQCVNVADNIQLKQKCAF